MKKIIAILFISIISKTLYSQSEVKGIDDVLLKIRINNNVNGTKNENYQNIEGNPYMFDNFQAGTVKLKNGNSFAGMLQYDIYAGTLYFKKNDTNYAIDLSNEIEYVSINESKLIYSNYITTKPAKETTASAYFEIVIDAKCQLLAKKNVSIKEGVQGNGIVLSTTTRFNKKNDTYFIKIDNKPAIEIKNNQSLISIFEKNSNTIETFIDKENVSYKRVEDLKKIVNYYNTL